MVEQLPFKETVAGSSPAKGTRKVPLEKVNYFTFVRARTPEL